MKTSVQSSISTSQATPTIELTQELVQRPSVTPKDEGCQELIAQRLEKLGFTIHHLPFGNTQNLWAIHDPAEQNQYHETNKLKKSNLPIFAFAGHTDVVPAGNISGWHTPPFTPTIKDGFLYGRGAADMKGSIAAMVTAYERLLDPANNLPPLPCRLAMLLTSDEEGPAHDGTKKVIEYLINNNIKLDYCIVGEPSTRKTLGDNIKIGRRGSMSGTLKIHGIQSHIAHPNSANPIHLALSPLQELITKLWDNGNEHFPPTSFQISNLNAGTGAGNVIPGILECWFNFRFSPEHSPETLQKEVQQIFENAEVQYDLHWDVSGIPFLTSQGKLLNVCQSIIKERFNIDPELSTDGGISDARFIAPMGGEVVEIGPLNSTIHRVNECVSINELNNLSDLYEVIIKRLF